MERIENLRLKALNAEGSVPTEFYYLFYKEYERLSHSSEWERYAEAFYFALSNLTPNIDKGELIVGKCATVMSEQVQKEWDKIYRPIAEARRSKAGGGQDSHMAIDYELLLKKGVNGIIADIDKYIAAENDNEKLGFYNACKRCLQGVTALAERYAYVASEMSRCTAKADEKAELAKLSEICKKVPAEPATTFYEAVQSVHFITHCISLNPLRMCQQQFQLGHPDSYLLKFYNNDLANGNITKEYAQLLLDCLGLQINMRVPSGLSSGYMIGGRDKDGNIVANDLTEMCMQVIEDIRLVYPAVGLCYTEGMPEKYLEKACEILSHGYSHPAIFGDDVITKGLINYGVPENEAHNYIHSTCVEITPGGASNVWVASPYTNMPYFLLNAMNREYPDFDSFVKTVLQALDNHIKNNFENENAQRRVRAENCINPLLSCFVNDCLKTGKDIEMGGAKYNWIMPSFVGMANFIDSLYAIKCLVFEQKRLTICEYKEILDNNFENNEALRLYILNKLPKYGNDMDEIDKYFEFFTEHLVSECRKYTAIHSNGLLIPSVFCWIMHEWFGRETSATPDGRKSGFPLGDGSGPCQGREMNGPTASVLSSTKWKHQDFIGGVAVNMKFSKASLGKNSLEAMKAIIKTYLQRGGFEMQINVVDNRTLKKAQTSPEEYKDLVVRIGGYSDYFVRLSPQMQEEVILRTEHNV